MDKDLSRVAKALGRLGFEVDVISSKTLAIETDNPALWQILLDRVRKPRKR